MFITGDCTTCQRPGDTQRRAFHSVIQMRNCALSSQQAIPLVSSVSSFVVLLPRGINWCRVGSNNGGCGTFPFSRILERRPPFLSFEWEKVLCREKRKFAIQPWLHCHPLSHPLARTRKPVLGVQQTKEKLPRALRRQKKKPVLKRKKIGTGGKKNGTGGKKIWDGRGPAAMIFGTTANSRILSVFSALL